MGKSGEEFERLVRLVRRLRAEDGCPWDREQTPATIKRYLLEEAYEVVEAVEQEAPAHVAEELGDLIFMAIFLAHLYGEQGEFPLEEVLRRVADKMVQRHPHVFGDLQVKSSQEVRLNWAEIKRRQSRHKPIAAVLQEVPRSLPALMRSHRMLSRLAQSLRRPFDQAVLRQQLQQVFSALHPGDPNEEIPAAELLGKLLLLVVAMNLLSNTPAEEALTQTLEHFCRQVERLEAILGEQGGGWDDLTQEQERSLWERL